MHFFNKKINVILTGYNGFIGGYLLNKLSKINCNVIKIGRKNDADLKVDFEKPIDYKNINIQKSKIDCFIHLAADLTFYGAYNDLNKINVDGAVRAFRLAEMLGIKMFIYASTIEAVGPQKDIALNEENCRINPVSNYGISKLIAENLLRHEQKRSDIDIIILRIGCVYHERSDKFFRETLDLAENKTSLMSASLIEIGDRFIQFINVNDVVDVIVKAIKERLESGTYFLTGDTPISIERYFDFFNRSNTSKSCNLNSVNNDFKKHIIDMKKQKNCDILTYFSSGDGHRSYSSEKIKNKLCWRNRHNIQDGIRKWLKNIKYY